MSYLLDTHTLLWARLAPNKLPSIHRKLIQLADEPKFISAISIWEISLKFSLGKLELGSHSPEEFLRSATDIGFQILSPTPAQFASFYQLPKVVKHKDPFDRMLIWQAIQAKLTLLSNDQQLPKYQLHGLALA